MATERLHRDEETWVSLIKECRASGQNVKHWCMMKGINRSVYYRWHSRLVKQGIIKEPSASEQKRCSSGEGPGPENHPCFVEFVINKEHSEEDGKNISTQELAKEFQETKIMIQRNSCQVFVGEGFSEDTLKRVLEVVGKC